MLYVQYCPTKKSMATKQESYDIYWYTGTWTYSSHNLGFKHLYRSISTFIFSLGLFFYLKNWVQLLNNICHCLCRTCPHLQVLVKIKTISMSSPYLAYTVPLGTVHVQQPLQTWVFFLLFLSLKPTKEGKE